MTDKAAHETLLIGPLSSWLAQTDTEGPPAEVRPGTEGDAIDGLIPKVVVRPMRIDHISAAMRFAGMHRLSVVPVGGRTQTHWGGAVERCDMLLDLSAMNRVLDYQPADMTITVEAGCTLADLRARLAEQRQFLPVDPPLCPEATVGGLVATNASGPLRLAYGTVRDALLGARFVRANGDVVQVGGRVVKNAAGYELTKLLTGSLGTLGVLAELTFMVRPWPEERRVLFIPVPRVETAEPIIATLLDATLEPVLLELANHAALQRSPAGVLPQEVQAPYGIFVGFMGSHTAVEWQVEHVRSLVAALPAPAGKRLLGYDLPWDATYESLLQVRRAGPEALVCRTSLLSSDIAHFLDRAERLLDDLSPNVPMIAHAASGVVHLYFDPAPADAEDLVTRLRALVDEAAAPLSVAAAPLGLSGDVDAAIPSTLEAPGVGDLALLRSLMPANLVIESAPAQLRRKLPVWGRRARHHDLSFQLKEKLDPDGLLNPGRLLGG